MPSLNQSRSAGEVVGDHEQLAELFLRRHAPQKILDPALDGQRGVAVGEGLAGSSLAPGGSRPR